MTQTIPFTQVDAFADAPFTGNPAAVMPLEAWLPDAVLQGIAAENNLAETAFTMALPEGSGADHELRWFTPTVEIALCGHATLASGHVLMGERDSITFRTRQAGDLIVAKEADSLSLRLPDWTASPKALPELAAAMGGQVVETLWRDSGYAVFVYRDEAAIRALQPDFHRLSSMGNILLIATAPGKIAEVVSRAFLPGGGIEEDPVTGSAHCVIADYWTKRLGRDHFTAYQASARGGHLSVKRQEDHVVLTGQCRTIIRGEYFL